MLLIIEIILTVLCWNKGWKWLSLIPLGVAFFIGFLIGLSGGTVGVGTVMIDLLVVIALIVMYLNPFEKKKYE